MVLLGDAAHAMQPNLGQGGGMAIEDACELLIDLDSAVVKCVCMQPPQAAMLLRLMPPAAFLWMEWDCLIALGQGHACSCRHIMYCYYAALTFFLN